MIDILFHFLNFAALLGVGYYLFRRYALASVRQEIAFERLQHAALHKRCTEIKKQREYFEVGYQLQEDLYQDLSAKMQQWQNGVQQRADIFEQRRKIIEEAVHRRREQQVSDRKIHELHVRVVPQAVERARQELQKVFASDEKEQHYRTSIFDYMRKVLQ